MFSVDLSQWPNWPSNGWRSTKHCYQGDTVSARWLDDTTDHTGHPRLHNAGCAESALHWTTGVQVGKYIGSRYSFNHSTVCSVHQHIPIATVCPLSNYIKLPLLKKIFGTGNFHSILYGSCTQKPLVCFVALASVRERDFFLMTASKRWEDE